MKKIDPINLNHWKELSFRKAKIEENIILPRIDEIVKIIVMDCFNGPKTYCWYFNDAEPEEVGTMKIKNGRVELTIDSTVSLEVGAYDYAVGFPENFLLMTDNAIVKYIKDQMNSPNRVIEEKLKIKQKAIEKIRKSLSPIEIDALGLHFPAPSFNLDKTF